MTPKPDDAISREAAITIAIDRACPNRPTLEDPGYCGCEVCNALGDVVVAIRAISALPAAVAPLDEGEIAEVIQSSWRDVAESDRIENELETLWANDKCLEVSVAALHAARAVIAHIEAKGGKR